MEERPEVSQPEPSPIRILIAEDDPTSCLVLERYLQQWGYDVSVARDGLDAWTLIENGDAPSLIILDWMMPGMDGVEICQKLRGLIFHTRPYVIFLTARSEMPDMESAFSCGADDFIRKPFDPQELRSRVQAGVRILDLQQSLSLRISQLEEAMAQIRTLHGLIPICSYCHKIRDDHETWQKMETYIQKHSEARFSHGICPGCLEIHYPEFYSERYNPKT